MRALGREDGRFSGARIAGVLALAWAAHYFCIPVAAAQRGPEAAIIAAMSGRVSVERAGELWAVHTGQTIEAGQAIVTGSDGAAQLFLPDGSTLEIFPNSRVIYRANRFNVRDLLDVLLGKVRLQIQHLLPGDTPLRVTSPTAVISVRGTVFEVEVDAAQDTTITVDTGAVGVRHRLFPGREILVQSGQSLRVAASLPLTAAGKSAVPIRTLGRVVQGIADTLAQIKAVRGASNGGTGSSSGSGGGGVPESDTGSNETKPPAGSDGAGSGDSGSGGSGSGPSAPPGDVLP